VDTNFTTSLPNSILVLYLYGNAFTEMGCEGPYELIQIIRHTDETTGWTNEKMGLDFRKYTDISLRHSVQTFCAANPASYRMGTKYLPRGKAAGD
jgi:hypothetical protein